MAELLPTRAAPLEAVPTETVPAETVPTEAGVTAELRRVVVRLVGENELDLGTFDDRGAALARAKEVIAGFSAAESAGEWPELEGRHLRPSSILSVDVLVGGS